MLLDRPLRVALLTAAESGLLRSIVSRYGFSLGAKRFVAGESADDFLTVAQSLNSQGFAVACGILGEGVHNPREATAASQEYSRLLDTFALRKIDANVAFKATHLGLDLDANLAFDNALRILEVARRTNNTIRLDMEQSRYVDGTLDLYGKLRNVYPGVGLVLQSYLLRSLEDLQRLLPGSPNVRIVKGAYLEPAGVAYQNKSEVDANYLRLVETAFGSEGYTAIATHDRHIVEQVKQLAQKRGFPTRGRFEFQLLYGISPALASELLAEGYRVRLAVPYGPYWFPYLMRRLAERPENLAFVLKGVFRRA